MKTDWSITLTTYYHQGSILLQNISTLWPPFWWTHMGFYNTFSL